MPGSRAGIIESLRNALIVSCQAEGNDPFNNPDSISRFAVAAQMGGAGGIRADGIENIRHVRRAVNLPLFGIIKGTYSSGDVLITPDFAEVEAIIEAGADIVALDVTERRRPNGMSGREFLAAVRKRWQVPLMADVSTIAEGKAAAAEGADLIGTTLSGYAGTPAPREDEPDWALLEALVKQVQTPVVMEGRVWVPDQARRALDMGAHAVVVGTAITRPRVVSRRFVDATRKAP